MTIFEPLIVNNRELTLPKTVVKPDIGCRTVLTNEPWDFVDLYLARNSDHDEARFYWQQAREFFSVATGLRLQSAPLLLYYTYLNATKALLSSKDEEFDEGHGVKEWKSNQHVKLEDLTVGVKIKNHGILHALATYYSEPDTCKTYSLEDIFFNLPYIHRTFSLTYDPSNNPSFREMFIPIVKPKLVIKSGTHNVYLTAKLTSNFPSSRYCKELPESLQLDLDSEVSTVVSRDCVSISDSNDPTEDDMTEISEFVRSLRSDIFYINGVQTLWYIKAIPENRVRIPRQVTTLTLAAMHRLSEESRYHPYRLAQCLEGEKNWIISEFIKMSSTQFIDEVASEITGQNILIPNTRPAT